MHVSAASGGELSYLLVLCNTTCILQTGKSVRSVFCKNLEKELLCILKWDFLHFFPCLELYDVKAEIMEQRQMSADNTETKLPRPTKQRSQNDMKNIFGSDIFSFQILFWRIWRISHHRAEMRSDANKARWSRDRYLNHRHAELPCMDVRRPVFWGGQTLFWTGQNNISTLFIPNI